MLLKISLIIAILAGAGTLAVTELLVKKKFEEAKAEKEKLVAQVDGLNSEKAKLSKQKSDLTTELGSVKTERDRANDTAKAAQEAEKKAEDDKAVAEMKTETAKQETQDTIKKFAALDSLHMTAPEIKTKLAELVRRKQELETANMERGVLGQAYEKLKGQWDMRMNPAQLPPTIRGVKGKVLAVDPKWQFVVVDVGLNQGVVPNGECLVLRGAKVIARIKLATVDPDQSIANVVKDGRIKVDSDILEGDVVVGQ